MPFKILAGIVAATLLFAFIGAVVVKLEDAALTTVVLIGLGLMLWDLRDSLRGERE
jgi:hypothetical protein